MFRLVVLLSLAGCGRVAFDPWSDGGDAGLVSDVAACTAPFGAPVQLTIDKYIKEPTVADDELEMYMDDGGELYVSTRPTTTSAWGEPVPVVLPPSNDAYNEFSASLTGDGLTLYFTSTRSSNAVVMRSTRATRRSAWELEEDSGPRGGAEVRADNLEIFSQDFVSAIRHMTRASTMLPFSNGADLPSPINDGSLNRSASISRDGLELYFASDRGGSFGLYVARRTSTSTAFTTVESLGIVGEMPEICGDGRHLYFIVNDGNYYNLWRASRCE